MASAKRIITVCLPTGLWCYRELLRGVGAYANAKGSWQVQYLTHLDNVREFLADRPPEGLLAGELWEMVDYIQHTPSLKHTVSVCANLFREGHQRVAVIDVANEDVGRIAADYFLERQYKHFAYIGYEGDFRPAGRGTGFQKAVESAGCHLHTFAPPWDAATTALGWSHRYLRSEVAPFLQALPKPLAVLGFNDVRGREVVEACRMVGLSVPEEVAILGIDNDAMHCNLSFPLLSSVNIPWFRIGYQAAEMLDRAMENNAKEADVLISPDGVVERQSTNSVAVSDSDVAAALLYIREHAHLPFSVDDVVEQTLAGRRTLEKRFRAQMGRSLLDEISRVRLERAKQLLSQTDLPVAEVAERCGFAKVNWFCTCFQKAYRLSPGKYRGRAHH